jgi:hypothetical protein
MVRHCRAFLSILCLVPVLSGCESTPTGPTEPLPVTRIVQGPFSGATAPDRLVIRSQQQLVNAWAVIFPGSPTSLPPRLPVVDFSSEMVIVAFAGAKPTSGYCIAIDGAAANRRTARITVRSVAPSAMGILPVVTQPFDVVRVPRRDEVTFTEVSVVGDC